MPYENCEESASSLLLFTPLGTYHKKKIVFFSFTSVLLFTLLVSWIYVDTFGFTNKH